MTFSLKSLAVEFFCSLFVSHCELTLICQQDTFSELLDKSVFVQKLIKIVGLKENIQLIKSRDHTNYAHF